MFITLSLYLQISTQWGVLKPKVAQSTFFYRQSRQSNVKNDPDVSGAAQVMLSSQTEAR